LTKKDTDITISHISRTFMAITYGTFEGICCFSFADPDPGSSVFLTSGSGSGMEENGFGIWGMNIPNYFSGSLETFFWVKNT
jgi:hypothetical protein